MKLNTTIVLSSLLASAAAAGEYFSEVVIREDAVHNSFIQSPLPHTYIGSDELPKSFNWGDVDGKSYLTKSLNQHIPQYCGSCWAHGALSSLGDRIKIARKAQGDDINLSIQFILNCGTEMAGSCHGGYHTSTYEFIQQTGYVPYDTCTPYVACSAESTEGFCDKIDTTCTAMNTCKTCDTFGGMGGKCVALEYFPNATVAEYGLVDYDEDDMEGTVHRIMSEIYSRGPVAATINAEPIVKYTGGVFSEEGHSDQTNHIVAIVGWGTDNDTGSKHWIVRNSWGQYWGEMGYMRLEMGKNLLGIEGEIAFAVPGEFTTTNYACYEDGSNCVHTEKYVDPSTDLVAVKRRLSNDNERKTIGNIRG